MGGQGDAEAEELGMARAGASRGGTAVGGEWAFVSFGAGARACVCALRASGGRVLSRVCVCVCARACVRSALRVECAGACWRVTPCAPGRLWCRVVERAAARFCLRSVV